MKRNKMTRKQLVSMKKQIPMPVMYRKILNTTSIGDNDYIEWCCPICGEWVEETDNYCSYCGQKLDWETQPENDGGCINDILYI